MSEVIFGIIAGAYLGIGSDMGIAMANMLSELIAAGATDGEMVNGVLLFTEGSEPKDLSLYKLRVEKVVAKAKVWLAV